MQGFKLSHQSVNELIDCSSSEGTQVKIQLSAVQNIQAGVLGLSMALTFVHLHEGIGSLVNSNNMAMCCAFCETLLTTLILESQ